MTKRDPARPLLGSASRLSLGSASPTGSRSVLLPQVPADWQAFQGAFRVTGIHIHLPKQQHRRCPAESARLTDLPCTSPTMHNLAQVAAWIAHR